jgi:hypothetical protein
MKHLFAFLLSVEVGDVYGAALWLAVYIFGFYLLLRAAIDKAKDEILKALRPAEKDKT